MHIYQVNKDQYKPITAKELNTAGTAALIISLFDKMAHLFHVLGAENIEVCNIVTLLGGCMYPYVKTKADEGFVCLSGTTNCLGEEYTALPAKHTLQEDSDMVIKRIESIRDIHAKSDAMKENLSEILSKLTAKFAILKATREIAKEKQTAVAWILLELLGLRNRLDILHERQIYNIKRSNMDTWTLAQCGEVLAWVKGADKELEGAPVCLAPFIVKQKEIPASYLLDALIDLLVRLDRFDVFYDKLALPDVKAWNQEQRAEVLEWAQKAGKGHCNIPCCLAPFITGIGWGLLVHNGRTSTISVPLQGRQEITAKVVFNAITNLMTRLGDDKDRPMMPGLGVWDIEPLTQEQRGDVLAWTKKVGHEYQGIPNCIYYLFRAYNFWDSSNEKPGGAQKFLEVSEAHRVLNSLIDLMWRLGSKNIFDTNLPLSDVKSWTGQQRTEVIEWAQKADREYCAIPSHLVPYISDTGHGWFVEESIAEMKKAGLRLDLDGIEMKCEVCGAYQTGCSVYDGHHMCLDCKLAAILENAESKKKKKNKQGGFFSEHDTGILISNPKHTKCQACCVLPMDTLCKRCSKPTCNFCMRATASGDAVCTKCNAEIAAERFELWKELKSKGWDLPLLEVQEWSQLTYNRILKNTPTANELSAMGVFNIPMGAPFTWSLEHLQEITSWVNSKEKTPIPLLCLLYERFGKWARYKDFASWGEVGQTTVRAYLENPKSMLKPPPHIMQVSVNFALDMANKLRPEYVIGSPFIMSMPIQEIKGIREWVTSGKHFEEPAVLVKWHKKLNIFNTVSLATPRPSSITTPITVTSYPGGITGEQTSTTFSR